jgi:RNA recognition motif-containing protein
MSAMIADTSRFQENNLMETKIYVGNFSYITTENDLRNLFNQAGTVNEVALIKDRDTGSPMGFAFITMNSPEEAKSAIEQFNGRSLGSRELKVNIALPRDDRPKAHSNSSRSGGYSGPQIRGRGRR